MAANNMSYYSVKDLTSDMNKDQYQKKWYRGANEEAYARLSNRNVKYGMSRDGHT